MRIPMNEQEQSRVRVGNGTTFRMPAESRRPTAPSQPAGGASHNFLGKGGGTFSGPVGRTQEERISAGASSRRTSRSAWAEGALGRVATASLFMLFFGFPLFFLSLSLQGLAFEKQIYFYFWLLVGVIAWVSRGVAAGELSIRRTPLDIPVLALWAAVGVSAIFSVDKWHSLWGFFGDPSRGFLSVTALVIAYFFIMSHVTLERFRLLLFAILLSGTLAGLWTFLVILGIPFLPQAFLAYAPLSLFGSMRSLLLFFGMLLPLFTIGAVALSRAEFSNGLVKRFAFAGLGIGFFLTLYSILAVYGFVPWLPILIGVSFLLIYVLAQVVHLGDRWNWLPMILFVLVLVFVMINQPPTFLRSSKVVIPPEVALDTKASWSIATEALKERLLVGSGPATFGFDFSRYKSLDLNRGSVSALRFFQGGSPFLEFLTTLGIIGAFAFVILTLVFLGVGFTGLSRERERNKIYSLGLWAASAMFIAALFLMPMNGPILLYGSLLSILAIVVLREESGADDTVIRLSFKASPKFALALAFLFMVACSGIAFLFAFIGKTFIADIYAGRAMAATEVNDDSIARMRRAIAFMPYEGRYYAAFGQMYMTVVNREAAKPENERNLDVIKQVVEQWAAPLVNTAMNRMPNDVVVHEAAGQVYENISLLAGSDPAVLSETTKIYKRALELEPKNPYFYIKLGLIDRVLAGRDDQKENRATLLAEGEKYFKSALDQKADFTTAYLNLGLTEEMLGNTDSAVDYLNKGMDVGGDPDVAFYLARILQIRNKSGDLDRAERLSQDLLRQNPKNVNVLLNLGFVYERKKDKNKAIDTYKKVLDVLSGDQLSEARDRVNDLIKNVESGKGNIASPEEVTSEKPVPTEIPANTESVTNANPVIENPDTTATAPGGNASSTERNGQE